MHQNRLDVIAKLSELRKSNVICYVTGDRGSIGTRIAPDIIPVFYEHLKLLDPQKPIDLFLYTKGGDVLAAIRLVELIYEYTDRFSVLIPYRSYSSGTLISLGASEIVMGRMGELSPIDPKVSGIFNPTDPYNPNAKIPISVEDLSAYFTIAKEMVGIHHEDSLTRIFSELLQHIHPVALGSVYRTHFLIRSVAERLLSKHIRKGNQHMIDEIIDRLTAKLFSHDYMITRREAKENIMLPVTYAEGELEDIMWALYKQYENELKLKEPFSPEHLMAVQGTFTEAGGVIESGARTDYFTFHGNIVRSGDGSHAGTSIIRQGWEEVNRNELQL